MIHNLPWHPVNMASCLAHELCLAELAGWTSPCLQTCFCSPVLVCCAPNPLLHAGVSGLAAPTLGWESRMQCPTSHPLVLTFSALERGGPDWHVFRSYRLMSLLRHLEPASTSAKCKRKVLTDIRKFWWNPLGWAGMKDRKYNLMFGVFFPPNYYLFMNIFIDFFDVLITEEAQQPDVYPLTYI